MQLHYTIYYDIKNDVHRNNLSRYFSNEHIKLKRPFGKNQFNSPYWGWLGATFFGMVLLLFFSAITIYTFEKETGVTIP